MTFLACWKHHLGQFRIFCMTHNVKSKMWGFRFSNKMMHLLTLLCLREFLAKNKETVMAHLPYSLQLVLCETRHKQNHRMYQPSCKQCTSQNVQTVMQSVGSLQSQGQYFEVDNTVCVCVCVFVSIFPAVMQRKCLKYSMLHMFIFVLKYANLHQIHANRIY